MRATSRPSEGTKKKLVSSTDLLAESSFARRFPIVAPGQKMAFLCSLRDRLLDCWDGFVRFFHGFTLRPRELLDRFVHDSDIILSPGAGHLPRDISRLLGEYVEADDDGEIDDSLARRSWVWSVYYVGYPIYSALKQAWRVVMLRRRHRRLR